MLETCTTCGDETGRAGAGDDSLYLDDDTGPYCERCFEIRCLRAEVERLTYELKRCGDTGFRLNEAYVTEWVKDDWDEIERLKELVQNTYYEAYADARSFSDKCALDMWPFSNARDALRGGE